MTVETIARLTGGCLVDVDDDQVMVTGPVVMDSRLITPGGVFCAFDGAHVDGHAFAAAAVAAGAAVVLASRPVGVPAVVVDDVQTALGALAAGVLRELPAVVVAVTGSAGKTSTKDLLGQVLADVATTIAPVGSFNNELGLPLTVLRADEHTRFLVLEMGARGKGHITYLTTIAPPKVAVVTNVGHAHAGEFGGPEKIAEAKAELVEALGPDGIAVLNADDPLVAAMASRTRGQVITYGTAPDAVVRAEDVALDELARPSFTLVAPGGQAPVRLRLHGAHHVSNALAAAGAAHALGVGVRQIATSLSAARQLSGGRMEVTTRPDGVTVVNDAYNANPESVRAALRAVEVLAGGRRQVVVLGAMRELGEDSPAAHRDIGELAARQATVVVTVGDGPEAAALAEGTGPGVLAAVDVPAALELLGGVLRAGDVVLVKASNGVGLCELARQLAEPHR
ncbi:UDP-N-acetylmuramoyl-tripeptide--D-alanyl-D-alanine ligase [Longispora fulva]|uniref:UDP-N-acetylmuramoyl-tripeptide--D-alanyl-D- alanine ligase n=1 Tax=Longispora fulva TaxID=619741 RepID=UPI0018CA00F9